jgi:hypothetical protein
VIRFTAPLGPSGGRMKNGRFNCGVADHSGGMVAGEGSRCDRGGVTGEMARKD